MDHQNSRSKDKDISALFFERPEIRRSILLACWAVVLLGVPLWWYTTSIERLPLPSTSHISLQSAYKPNLSLNLNLIPGPLAHNADPLVQQIRSAFGSDRDVSVKVGGALTNIDLPYDYTVEVTDKVSYPVLSSRHLSLPAQDAATRLPDMLSSLVYPYTAGYHRRGSEHLVAQFAPRYRLAFTLLNEDAASGTAMAGWDIRNALLRHISPIFRRLSALHNFTVESQVHLHAPLAFEPIQFGPELESVHGLSQDDLKVFVNSAEWNLASQVSNDPVLHFVVFVPSPSHTPLRILDNNNKVTLSNAFILPQWGGIVISNQPANGSTSRTFSADDLNGAFTVFRKQLLVLLGVSELPADYEIVDAPISDWQLDTLYRQRALENIASSRETLQSIVKLVDQIPNMPVGHDVKDDFQSALDALEKAYSTALDSPLLILQYSARAATYASRAFFSPGMLALLYFPPEHTYAVYTPLFFPMLGPLVATAIREIVAWRKARNARPATTAH